MLSVNRKTKITASADEVWKTIADFNGLGKFVAAVAKSDMEGEGTGAVRTLTTVDGGQIVERLESHDDSSRTLSYRITSSPWPLLNYVSTMHITPTDDGHCELEWSCEMGTKEGAEQEMQETIAGIYEMGFDGLKKLYGG